MLAVGQAVGLEILGSFNPAAGLQVQVRPGSGAAPKVMQLPSQMLVSMPASTMGFGLRVMTTVSVSAQAVAISVWIKA